MSCITCLVTGLDFYTIPDSLAPHSHRHPHWVSHPSRWSIDWLCLSLPFSHGAVQWTVWALISSQLSLCWWTFILVCKRLHPCWLFSGFQRWFFFPLVDGDISTWVDPRFHFCLCLNLCDITLPVSVTQKLPVLWGGHNHGPNLGLEHSTQVKMLLKCSPQFSDSH